MGVYILYKGNHFFIDCLANHSHDHHFTRAGWQRVLSILESMDIKVGEVVKKVIIWSDGGLKTKENLLHVPRDRDWEKDHNMGQLLGSISRALRGKNPF